MIISSTYNTYNSGYLSKTWNKSFTESIGFNNINFTMLIIPNAMFKFLFLLIMQQVQRLLPFVNLKIVALRLFTYTCNVSFPFPKVIYICFPSMSLDINFLWQNTLKALFFKERDATSSCNSSKAWELVVWRHIKLINAISEIRI